MRDPRELLAALVACPSVSGAERDVADLATIEARELGLVVERVGDSVVVRAPGERREAPRLLLCSHLDTVPVGEGWTSDPYAARWRDGRLVGRGANDAKASAAAMLWALAQCAQDGTAAGVAVALNACEETTNTGMAEVLAAIGRPALAVVGEPTGLEVVRAQGGLGVLEAVWEGRSCHAAHVARREHVNALVRAAEELAAFGPFAALENEHPLLGPTTIAPTVLASGERHNVVPDRATALLDCRITPPLDAEVCRAFVQQALPRARVNVRSARLGPVETPADHPLVVAALAASGKERAIGSNTMSDMALLPGVPAVKCGPGETARSHTPDEYVTEDELLAGCAFYRTLVTALAGIPVGSAGT